VTLTLAAAIAFLVMLVLAAGVWLASLRRRDASIADICWGPGFVAIAWLYVALWQAWRPRPLVVAGMITVWGVRLAVHIARRHRGEDPRYTAMRASHGDAFWWRSLIVVFWLQAAFLWFVAMPLLTIAAFPAPVAILDVVGAALFAIGFTFEAVGDGQLARFRSNPANRGRVLDTGLWRYTRHPNYFGDAVMWWGIYLIACATREGAMTILSPSLMTLLLLRVSGVTLLEQSLKLSKPGYADYIRRTSAFVPWFPRAR
jgi:steroid 5-alpha reductase family enzyme